LRTLAQRRVQAITPLGSERVLQAFKMAGDRGKIFRPIRAPSDKRLSEGGGNHLDSI
jgi:hypothetical protein